MRTTVILLLLLILGSCRSSHLPISENNTADSLRTISVRSDSIVVHDSIYIVERGDTVFQYKYKYIYRDRVLHDTLHHHRCDTITQFVEVEKQLTFWQQKKMEIGSLVMWIAPFIAAIMLVKWKFL
jgi:hypothetical protein